MLPAVPSTHETSISWFLRSGSDVICAGCISILTKTWHPSDDGDIEMPKFDVVDILLLMLPHPRVWDSLHRAR